MGKLSDIEMLKHLSIQALELTEGIVELVKSENVDLILKRLDERDRVINIMSRLLAFVPPAEVDKQIPEFKGIINKITKIDELIMTDLIRLKDSVHLEIAKTFKTKENFKGYNLNNIK